MSEQTAAEVSEKSPEKKLEDLKEIAQHYDNATSIIAHSEFLGHQAAKVSATLQFLVRVKKKIEADIAALTPQKTEEKSEQSFSEAVKN